MAGPGGKARRALPNLTAFDIRPPEINAVAWGETPRARVSIASISTIR